MSDGSPIAATAPADMPEAAESAGSTVTIDGRLFPIKPHHCFACGDLNVDGLRLRLHIEGDGCWTELRLADRFEGWQGIAHGGIVCTILDEVMAWSLARTDSWGVTARMAVDFKRPVPVGAPIRAEGRLVRSRRRLHETEARLVDARDGTVLALATAVYVAASPEQRRALKARYGFPDLGESVE
jgi:uncharacterized protein (TIGR00369 family)